MTPEIFARHLAEIRERRRRVERLMRDLRVHVDAQMGELLQELQAVERLQAELDRERGR